MAGEKKSGLYDMPCWDNVKYRHPGGDRGVRRLAELERGYRQCEEGYFLNLCCGDGTGMEWFGDYKNRCYGADYSESLLRRAKERFPEFRFVHCDVTNDLPFPPQWAAAVLCECSLSLFGSDRGKIIRQIYRIMRPGGLLLLADVSWGKEEPEGFLCLEYEEYPDWIREFTAAWLWENGSLPPLCGMTDKDGERGKSGSIPGYFLGVYRRCE